MPLKTQKTAKKRPQHYAKVYWPYLPLIILMSLGLWFGRPLVERSQRGVLAYSTNVSAQSLLIDSNQARQTNGQAALRGNPQLDAAAQAKAQDMANQNYWSHITPDTQTPWRFIDATGYNYQKAGENLAYGFSTSQEVITGWMSSPTHKANVLDSQYQDVGFGIVNSPNYLNKGPETIVVALYGTPANSAMTVASSASINGFNSLQNTSNDSNGQSVSKIQVLTGGKAPWISLAIGLLAGVGIAFIIGKYTVKIHRVLRKGEKFVLKHPLFDLTVIALIAVCAVLSRSAGLIR